MRRPLARKDLRDRLVRSLTAQGFRVRGTEVLPPRKLDKPALRRLQATAVRHRIERAEAGLLRHEPKLLGNFAEGSRLDPGKISPYLVEVLPDSSEELLFRYAALHWSVPVSSGYGRRIRFLVRDKQNDKLIGLFGLGDPVFSLASRDSWVGWDQRARLERLRNVMDAFVLGSVPPYSSLLCGKLVAMLVASEEVRQAFHRKYDRKESVIRHRQIDGRLALVTTTSALGRSSLYNRIKYHDRLLYRGVGFTKGSGEFHFANGLYADIANYAAYHCEPTARHEAWGEGFRSRREVMKKVLPKLGLSPDWIYHGIQREVFVVPMATNTRPFLRGEHSKLLWFDQPAEELASSFRARWLLPRAERDSTYKGFEPSSYAIWSNVNGNGRSSRRPQ